MRPLLTAIVCTYNRKATLQLCLKALEAQSLSNFEVIVIDDGSSDDTLVMLTEYQQTTTLNIRVLSQQNAGPASARNVALKHTRTPYALLLGDDILATPKLVETHLKFHQENPAETAFALGCTRWDSTHQEVTPFMKWYEKHQFDYKRLEEGLPPTWQHAYTSNLSFKTHFLQQNRFDERFRAAAWEDSELAYRLWQKDLFQLTFIQRALATHIHPTTFRQAWKRMETLGRAERLVHALHPELKAEIRSDLLSRICSFLGRRPLVLQLITSLIGTLRTPTKLHSMVLRGHHQLTYLAGTAEKALP